MAVVAFGNLVPPAAAIISAPLLARTLGVDGRGDVASATAPLLLATALATLGLPEATAHFVARDAKDLRSAVRKATILVFVAGILAALVFSALSGFLSGDSHQIQTLIVMAMCALPLTLVVAVLRGAASGLRKWNLVATEQVLSASSRILLLVGLVFTSRLTVLEATLVTAATPLIGGFAYLRITRDSSAVRTRLNRDFSRYGLQIWIGSVSGILLLRFDQTLMVPLSGPRELGLYAVAVSVSEVTLVVNNAIRDVVFVSDVKESSLDALYATARVAGVISSLFAIVIAATLPLWFVSVFGPGFRPAIPVTVILLLASALGTPGSVAGAGLGARGKPALRSYSLLIACVINALVILALVPKWGATGAAIATLIGNLISSNLNIYFMARNFGARPAQFYLITSADVRAVAARVGLQRRSRVG